MKILFSSIALCYMISPGAEKIRVNIFLIAKEYRAALKKFVDININVNDGIIY